MRGSLWKGSSTGAMTGTGSGGLASVAGLSFFHGGGSTGEEAALQRGSRLLDRPNVLAPRHHVGGPGARDRLDICAQC